jgi:hypothetical protein
MTRPVAPVNAGDIQAALTTENVAEADKKFRTLLLSATRQAQAARLVGEHAGALAGTASRRRSGGGAIRA